MKVRSVLLAALALSVIAGTAMAQLPGQENVTPLGSVFKASTGTGEIGQYTLSQQVWTGYVVLLETPGGGTGNTNWSDVIVFSATAGAAPNSLQPNGIILTYISDDPAGPGYITASDLGAAGMAGLTIAQIQAGPTEYINEVLNASTPYVAGSNSYLFVPGGSPADLPGFGTVGLVILAALLTMTGVVFVVRRRATGDRLA